jgi:hypothetical protein
MACAALSLASGFLGAAIGVKLMSRQPATNLRVHELKLIDQQGRVRASLSTNDQGDPYFDLLDKAGKVDASLADGQMGPRLDLAGSDPLSSVYLGIPNGKPILGFSGDGREGRVIVGYNVDDDTIPSEMGHWGLTVTGSSGKRIAMGLAMTQGREGGTFAELPKKGTINFPLIPPEPAKLPSP